MSDPVKDLERLVEDCDGDTLDSYELQLATQQYNLPALLARVKAMEADAYAKGVRDAAEEAENVLHNGEMASMAILSLLDGKGVSHA